MDQKTFEELVNDSSLLDKESLSALEQLVKEYPFSQSLQLLYTKNLYQLKNYRYHQQLKLAAAVVGDRSRLKHYIEDPDPSKVMIKQSVQVAPKEVKEREAEKVLEAIPTIEEPVAFVPEVKENAISDGIVFILEPELPMVAEESLKGKKNPEFVLEQPGEVVNEPLGPLSNLDTEISRAEKKRALIARINQKFAEREAKGEVEMPVVVMPGVDADEKEVAGVEIVAEAASEASPLTLEEEVMVVDPVATIASSEAPEELTDRSDEPDIQPLTAPAEEVRIDEHQAQKEGETKEVIPATELIERFIRNAPSISRQGKRFYNPVNLAAQSLEEREEFYTETYASICLRQGNVEKALKIYAQLSLKFPEKSSYFAGLIEKVKKEQNI